MIDHSEAEQSVQLRPTWQAEIIRCAIICVLGNRYYLTEEKYSTAVQKRRQRGQTFAAPYVAKVDEILQDADLVTTDPQWADEQTLLYYKEYAGLVDGQGNPQWIVAVAQLGTPNFIWTVYPAPQGQVKTWLGQQGKILYRR